MLTLGVVNRGTDCKADNRRDQRIQRTASSCQLAQKWIVGLVTLGPKRTCNMGYDTTDDALEMIEISTTKHSKPEAELQVYTYRCTFRRDFQDTFGDQGLNNTTSLQGCPAQGKAVFVIADAKKSQPKRIQTSDFDRLKLVSKIAVLELVRYQRSAIPIVSVCQTRNSPKLRTYRRSLALCTIQRGSLWSSMEDRTEKLDSQF